MLSLDIENLAERAIKCLETSKRSRILISVVGIPGSGKSTVAQKISEAINQKSSGSKIYKSLTTSMDGFHLTREELFRMENSELAFKRRGAPFTFDSHALVNFVKVLRESCSMENPPIIEAPSFDHKLKDPIANSIKISSDVNIVIIEGLYLMSTEKPWNELGYLMDERWLIEVDLDTARERLAKRHVYSKLESSMKSAFERVDQNDSLNGIYVLNNLAKGIDVKVRNTITRFGY